jgi:hypothetical protein
MISSALAIIHGQRSAIRLFGVAVDKAHVAPRDPVEMAFEEICNRFNLFLARSNNRESQSGNSQRGLVTMDEMRQEQPLQSIARHFRVNGTRWGALRNMAEVPVFVDSRASRLVQLADLIAYALWGEDTPIKMGGSLNRWCHSLITSEGSFTACCIISHARFNVIARLA